MPTDAIAAAAARGVEAAGGCALGLHLRDKSGQRYNNHTVHEQRPGDIFANFPVQNEAELWPRLRAAMAGRGDEKNGGGLFIAADGHSQGLRARLVDAARRENVTIRAGTKPHAAFKMHFLGSQRRLSCCPSFGLSCCQSPQRRGHDPGCPSGWLPPQVKIVEPDWLGSKPPIELVAYTENLILSQCAQLVLLPCGYSADGSRRRRGCDVDIFAARMFRRHFAAALQLGRGYSVETSQAVRSTGASSQVPTGHPPSTFFAMAAARAVASNPRVRAALACPASRVEASPLSPSGESQPCLFEPSCPDPSVRFSGGHNKFGILHR